MRIQIQKLMIFSVLTTMGALFATDLEPINIRLSDAEKEARALSTDAQVLASLSMSDAHWSTHALKLREITEHSSHLRHIVQDMVNVREAGSAWQQTAIDRMTPTLNELATTLESTIEELNRHPSQVHTPRYRKYTVANAELAANLAQTISDFVKYAHAKQRFEALSLKLEISSNP